MKKSLISSSHFLMWILVSLVILTAQNVAHAQTFTDTTFNNSAWNSVLLPNSASGASFTASQDTSKGNPIPSRLTTHTYPPGPIFVAHLSVPSTYDPASQGAIVKLGYSYGLVHYTNLRVGYSILIFQNNTYYYNLPGDLILGSGTTFTNFSRQNLTASSFTKLDGPSSNVNPDFSCSGSPIVFGYVTRNSNPNPNTTDVTTSAIDNWTVTIEEKRPCCGTIGEARVTCDRGVFTSTFLVTNNSAQTIQYLLLSPPAGATFTISPNVINLGANALNPGQSTTVSVTITNASPGDHICINVALADRSVVSCCTIQTCIDLPDCPCLRSLDTAITCGANGSYNYTVVLQNLTGAPIQQIFIVPTQPSTVNASPQLVALSTPLQPNQTTTLTLSISGAPPGSRVCLRFAPFGAESQCCSTEICFTVPVCPP